MNGKDDRADRLAAALRANLKRRKAHARGAEADASARGDRQSDPDGSADGVPPTDGEEGRPGSGD